jgi:hypothetical protein
VPFGPRSAEALLRKVKEKNMFTTAMKDDLDGATYPEGKHETEEQARQYAALRSGQTKCEIKVCSGTRVLDIYRDGEPIAKAVAQ